MTITNKVSLKSVMAGNTPIADVPDAPTIGTATDAAGGTVTVAYTAAVTGGTATTFTATSTPGTLTATGTSPITVTGLTSGTAYTFKVKGTNTTATGPESAASNSITPLSGNVLIDWGINSSYNYGVSNGSGGTVIAEDYTARSISSVGSTNTYLWTKTIQSYFNDNTLEINDTCADSSGNLYLAGYVQKGTTANQHKYPSVVFKYNSSGTIQWAVVCDPPAAITTYVNTWKAITTDSSGNVYVAGTCTAGYRLSIIVVVKYNSSGTQQWVNTYGSNYTGSGPTSDDATSITVDSSGNVFVGSYLQATGPYYGDINALVKINSSGVTQWTKGFQIGIGYVGSLHQGSTTDSSGNIYTVGRSSASNGASTSHLMKFNTSGTVLAEVCLTPPSSLTTFGRTPIQRDSSGNIYIIMNVQSSYYTLAKYDSSFVIQWQRNISPGAGSVAATFAGFNATTGAIKVNMAITSGVSTKFIGLEYMPDGSATGTYTTLTSGYSVTIATGTCTAGSISSTAVTPAVANTGIAYVSSAYSDYIAGTTTRTSTVKAI